MSNKLKFELKDGPDRRKRKSEETEAPVFKTEEMLKQEARERLVEQEKLIASKPPPSVRRSKFDNYIYHYKWHTIVACIGVLLLVFFIRDTVFRPKPDLSLVIATSRFITQAETEALQAALGNITGDLNGDGRVLVNLDSINLPITSIMEDLNNAGMQDDEESFDISSATDPEMMQASMMKLMAIIAAGTDTLFLLDDEVYDYITMMSEPSVEDGEGGGGADANTGGARNVSAAAQEYAIFNTLSGIPGSFGLFEDRIAIKDTVLQSEPALEYMGDLAFSLRPPPNSKQGSIDYYTLCIQLLNTLTHK